MADLGGRARKLRDGAWAQAARLYAEAATIDTAGDASQDELDDAKEAMTVIEYRFPDVAEGVRDNHYDAEAYIAERGGRGKKPVSGGVRQASKPGRERGSGGAPGARPRAAGASRRGRSSRAFGSGFLLGRGSAAEATGLPGATRSITGVVLYGVGGIVGLSILYDVLRASDAGAHSAPVLFVRGITGFLGRLVSPDLDPLAPPAGKKESRPAAASLGTLAGANASSVLNAASSTASAASAARAHAAAVARAKKKGGLGTALATGTANTNLGR